LIERNLAVKQQHNQKYVQNSRSILFLLLFSRYVNCGGSTRA